MSQKTIAIVGSRPGAKHCDADIAYFINGSIEHSGKYSQSVHHTHIIAGKGVLTRYHNHTGRDDDWETQWLDAFRDQSADYSIIKGNCDIDEVMDVLGRYNYTAKEAVNINQEESGRIIREVIGSRPPLGLFRGFDYGLKNGLFIYKKLFNRLLHYRTSLLHPNTEGWPIFFSPSNGVLALLHAIQTYGADNKFMLIGIGLDPYDYAYDFNGQLIQKNLRLRFHILGDEQALKKVSRRFDIATDDEYIAQKFSLPIIGDRFSE